MEPWPEKAIMYKKLFTGAFIVLGTVASILFLVGTIGVVWTSSLIYFALLLWVVAPALAPSYMADLRRRLLDVDFSVQVALTFGTIMMLITLYLASPVIAVIGILAYSIVEVFVRRMENYALYTKFIYGAA